MIFNRIAAVCFSLFILLAAVSCSSTSETTTSETTAPAEDSKFPSWYNSSRILEAEDDAFHTYATAIAADSIESLQKAGAQAKSEMASGVSSRLESIRNDAVVELGSESGLDSPKFIIALRNAESDIASAAEISESEAKGNSDGNFRAFARASVDKETLVEELDKALSANGNAWNNMKESQAFTKY